MAQSVTLIGAGKMGAAMARRWGGAGRDVVVWNRTPETAQALAGPRIRAERDLVAAVRGARVVVSILTDGNAVRSVLVDHGGIAAMEAGSTLVDLSTIDVGSSRAVAGAAAERGVAYVRGAVSGTPGVVAAGNAALLLSGPPEALDAARDVLDDVTPKHAVVGAEEESRVVKLATNLMLAVTVEALAEATVLAESCGVSREVLLDALGNTVIASPFLAYKSEALAARDYQATFTTAGMVKDLKLAVCQGAANGVPMPITTGALGQFRETTAAGYGDDDFLSVFRLQQLRSNVAVDSYEPR
ncbi:NAD(P)-dependent oxidoreductase [Nonomuraea sp. K274]|uniref:NAD(P)-dependent oxidoreductase n=1 Tax=Nonomuraea cypriaca TaxID=1187855 RepID=A0A931A4U2_9ACTN|nr:NAD(P)-dependent oxidoreductase [Nonomuraea cypriaca]MBF8185040.1 NAD(P)-dependent oxidoreductase [Nonomuraea cypriaca]